MANIVEPADPGFPPVYQIDLEDDVIGGEDGISNRQGKQLVERTAYNKKAVELEVADRTAAAQNLQAQVNANRDSIIANTAGINAMKGRGGYLMAHDFGTEAPTQQELTDYALLQISSDDPLDIWNSTHVKNLFNSHVWALTNTPDTLPPIFEWVDDGIDAVTVATEETLGVVKSSEDEGYVSVEPATGKMRMILPTGTVAADALSVIARHRPFVIASGKRQVTIRRRTYIPVEINSVDRWFRADEDIVVNVEDVLGSALQNGKDYNIFLAADGEGFEIKIDTADTPNGYTADQVMAIGGFHSLCVDAGTGMSYLFGGNQFDHPLNGYVAGDILPASVWCLNHRPHSSPKGMVYIPSLDFWADIYLQSGTGPNTKSVYQGAITRSRQYVDFVEDQFCVSKALLNDEEFAAAMLGSNEQTAVLGANETGATTGGAGGRKDTAQRRMISIYGCEEGCGSIWQWLATTSAAGGTGWNTQSGGKGNYYGGAYALLAGGAWGDSANCGSRCRDAESSRSSSHAVIGGRGRSRPARVFG